MNKNLRKRRSLVLLEIVVALMILGVLTAGIAKTARGVMELTRYRKSIDLNNQITTALENHLFEKGESIDRVLANWRQIARMSPLIGAKNPLSDGWGCDVECFSRDSDHEMARFQIKKNAEQIDQFILTSKGLYNYQKTLSNAKKG